MLCRTPVLLNSAFLISAAGLLAGCGDENSGGNDAANDPSGNGAESKSAAALPESVKVANKLLRAMHGKDAAAVKALLNENNSRMSLDDVKGMLDEVVAEFDGVKAVTEARMSASRYPEGTVLAKLREGDGETFVLVLTPEAGSFRFEDINSPSTSDYNALDKIWP